MKKIFGSRIAMAVACTLMVIGAELFASKVGHRAGQTAGAQAKERLQLVWPSIMSLPEVDREFLAGLALTCRLEQRPARADEVVDCLREAIDNPHVLFPKGLDRNGARIKLDALLLQRAA